MRNKTAGINDASSCHFLGSGPGRGRSPVEWGDFPSVRSSVPPRLALRPSSWPSEPSSWTSEPFSLPSVL